MKTVLVYVITCWQDPYPKLTQASLETWDAVNVEGVETRFYCGLPKHPDQEKVLQLTVPEGLLNMGRKDLAAYRYALDNLSWDYMARVNVSCYVRKRKLLERCQSLPTENVFQGIGYICEDQLILWGGSQYIISRDVVKAFVDNGSLWDHSKMEDVSMSRLANKLNIPLDTKGCFCSLNKNPGEIILLYYYNGESGGVTYKSISEIPPDSYQYFIRVKQDLRRWEDVEMMKELHSLGV